MRPRGGSRVVGSRGRPCWAMTLCTRSHSGRVSCRGPRLPIGTGRHGSGVSGRSGTRRPSGSVRTHPGRNRPHPRTGVRPVRVRGEVGRRDAVGPGRRRDIPNLGLGVPGRVVAEGGPFSFGRRAAEVGTVCGRSGTGGPDAVPRSAAQLGAPRARPDASRMAAAEVLGRECWQPARDRVGCLCRPEPTGPEHGRAYAPQTD